MSCSALDSSGVLHLNCSGRAEYFLYSLYASCHLHHNGIRIHPCKLTVTRVSPPRCVRPRVGQSAIVVHVGRAERCTKCTTKVLATGRTINDLSGSIIKCWELWNTWKLVQMWSWRGRGNSTACSCLATLKTWCQQVC